MTSRRRFRLDSERETRDIIDILQNDEDSDIEENTTIIETEGKLLIYLYFCKIVIAFGFE